VITVFFNFKLFITYYVFPGLVFYDRSYYYGNVASWLADLVGATLSAGSKAFEDWALVCVSLRDYELGFIQSCVVFGVGYCRSQNFDNWFAGAVGHEFEQNQGFLVAFAANLVEDSAHFEGGGSDVAGDRLNFGCGIYSHFDLGTW